jgi:pimeloyl-ACP methyl ester carboxylesterase
VPAALTETRIDTALGKVQVYRGGPRTGDALVYLHSATGEGAGLAVLEQLAETFDVLVPMFPGFGESEGIEGIDDIEDAVFHLLDVLDQLGLRSPSVMGMSLGGWMAAELAMRYPAAVGRLVLVNPAGLYVEGHPIKEIFGRQPGELAQDLFADQSHPMAQMMYGVQAIMDAKGEIPFELMKPALQSLAATAKVAWNPYLHDPKLRRLLYRVTAPTLIVHGAGDRLIDRTHAEAYAEGIRNTRLVDVEGAGHLLALEKPAELAELVAAFLAAPRP